MKRLTQNEKVGLFIILVELLTLILVITFWVLVFMALIKFIKGA